MTKSNIEKKRTQIIIFSLYEQIRLKLIEVVATSPFKGGLGKVCSLEIALSVCLDLSLVSAVCFFGEDYF